MVSWNVRKPIKVLDSFSASFGLVLRRYGPTSKVTRVSKSKKRHKSSREEVKKDNSEHLQLIKLISASKTIAVFIYTCMVYHVRNNSLS